MTDTGIISVDPGKSGATVVMDTEGVLGAVEHDKYHAKEAPYFRLMDYMEALGLMVEGAGYTGRVRAVIEIPNSRPGEGAQRSRNFGLSIGMVYAAVAVYTGREVTTVVPQRWTRAVGVPGKTVDGWRRLRVGKAIDRIEGIQQWLYTPRGRLRDGILDAALIGHWYLNNTRRT